MNPHGETVKVLLGVAAKLADDGASAEAYNAAAEVLSHAAEQARQAATWACVRAPPPENDVPF